jgi:hypothetical protein
LNFVNGRMKQERRGSLERDPIPGGARLM